MSSQTGPNGLLLNLGSNNPFRNKNSPLSATFSNSANLRPVTPVSPFDDPRPSSSLNNNPFLDPSAQVSGPTIRDNTANMASRPESKLVSDTNLDEIFGSLNVEDDKAKQRRPSPAPPRPTSRVPTGGAPPGGPQQARRPPPPGVVNAHRPTRSQQGDDMRTRRAPPRPGQGGGHAQSPARRPGDRDMRSSDRSSRPRRNSDSSIVDRERIMSQEEKVLREARRRARESSARIREDGKKPNKRMDIIDQLDASSIFGMGIVHHDGPYDALNPHRNRGSSRRDPMQAFPEGSLNNALGGSGPLNARPDHQTFMGNHTSDAFADYTALPKVDAPEGVFDPASRGHIVHGDESMGLGSSTFLEGTPVARTVLQKKEQEQAEIEATEGIKRQKSLAHRIRSVRRPNRNYPPGYKGVQRQMSDQVPLPTRAEGMGESQPFVAEYGQEPESLTVRGKDSAPSPPAPRGRTMSDDVNAGNSSGGLLSRVKSLKGGRRTRPQVDSGESVPVPSMNPGTAV